MKTILVLLYLCKGFLYDQFLFLVCHLCWFVVRDWGGGLIWALIMEDANKSSNVTVLKMNKGTERPQDGLNEPSRMTLSRVSNFLPAPINPDGAVSVNKIAWLVKCRLPPRRPLLLLCKLFQLPLSNIASYPPLVSYWQVELTRRFMVQISRPRNCSLFRIIPVFRFPQNSFKTELKKLFCALIQSFTFDIITVYLSFLIIFYNGSFNISSSLNFLKCLTSSKYGFIDLFRFRLQIFIKAYNFFTYVIYLFPTFYWIC